MSNVHFRVPAQDGRGVICYPNQSNAEAEPAHQEAVSSQAIYCMLLPFIPKFERKCHKIRGRSFYYSSRGRHLMKYHPIWRSIPLVCLGDVKTYPLPY